MRRRIGVWSGMMAMIGVAFAPLARANAQQIPGPPSASGILFQVGAGRYSSNWNRLPGNNASKVFSVGVGVDLVASDRIRAVIDASYAASPDACADQCAVSGPFASASVLVSKIEQGGSIGLAIGPSLVVSNFDQSRFGGGVRADFGVMRGIGPRVIAQFSVADGGRKFATVHAAIRLGRRFRSDR